MTEVPEHLLQRSRDRRRAMGLAVDGDDAAPAAAESAATPAVAAAAAPAVKAPVPIAAGEPPKPPEPDSEWVAAAKSRQKIPYWVMPVLLFLPIWLIMYVGTLEEPTREEGVLYEGSLAYAEGNCGNCHGAGGAGGTGPAFANGAIVETFALAEDQMAWIVHGSQGYLDAGFEAYGNNDTRIGAYNANALMPAFGEALTAKEIVAVVFYERIELGGYEEETALAEHMWDMIEHGEIELPDHWNEGPDGDFTDTIVAQLEIARADLDGEGEAAAE